MSFWLVQNPSYSERFQTSWNDVYLDIIIVKEESKRAKSWKRKHFHHGIGDASI